SARRHTPPKSCSAMAAAPVVTKPRIIDGSLPSRMRLKQLPASVQGEPRGQGGAEVPARLEVGGARRPDDADVIVHLAPTEAGGDRVHRSLGTGRVVAAVDVEPERPALRRLPARVVHLVEEVLEGTGDVTEVGR